MWATTDSAIEAYAVPAFVWVAGGAIIAVMDGFRISHALLQSILVILWIYWAHRWLHSIFKVESLSGYLNPHTAFHHMKCGNIPRWLELTIEFITDMSIMTLPLIIQYFVGIHMLSIVLVLFSTLVYSSAHIVLYSICGSDYHKSHHTTTYCNYSPEFMDFLFDSRCEPSKPYNVMMIEMVLGIPLFGLIAGYLYFARDWDKVLTRVEI